MSDNFSSDPVRRELLDAIARSPNTTNLKQLSIDLGYEKSDYFLFYFYLSTTYVREFYLVLRYYHVAIHQFVVCFVVENIR